MCLTVTLLWDRQPGLPTDAEGGGSSSPFPPACAGDRFQAPAGLLSRAVLGGASGSASACGPQVCSHSGTAGACRRRVEGQALAEGLVAVGSVEMSVQVCPAAGFRACLGRFGLPSRAPGLACSQPPLLVGLGFPPGMGRALVSSPEQGEPSGRWHMGSCCWVGREAPHCPALQSSLGPACGAFEAVWLGAGVSMT